MREIEEMLKILKSTIDRHIQRLEPVKKFDIWIPNEFDPFLKRIITGEEKWIVQNNFVRKRSWSKRDQQPQTTSKAELHGKKIMLFVW